MIVVVAYVHEFVGTGGFTVCNNIHVLQLQATESLFLFICQVLLLLFIAYYFVSQCVSIYFKRFSFFLNKWNWLEIFQLLSVVVVVVDRQTDKQVARQADNSQIDRQTDR